MIDKILKYGSMFDWITPIFTWIQDFRNHPSVGYNIDVNGGWSALAIGRLMKESGVKIWGLTIFGDIITFRVRVSQARYAQYLMVRQGIPFVGGVTAEQGGRSTRQTPAHAQHKRSARKQQSLIDQLDRAIRRL